MDDMLNQKNHEKREITISETTLRGIFSDYIYKRLKYKKQMKWESQFSDVIIILGLEEKPSSQESLGYKLQNENITNQCSRPDDTVRVGEQCPKCDEVKGLTPNYAKSVG